MSALLTARIGDRITVVNGVTLPEPLTIEAFLGDSVRVTPPRESVVEWRLYADQHDVAVETPTPVPPKPRKPRAASTRTVAGVTLVSHGDGWWESTDGTWSITREEAPTSCDDTHPVRITPAMRRLVKDRPQYALHTNPALYLAASAGRSGYVCEGGGEHTYVTWVLARRGEAVEFADTFADCAALMEREVAR